MTMNNIPLDSYKKNLPPDLWPRTIQRGEGRRGSPEFKDRSVPPPYETTFIGRAFQGSKYMVTTTPQRLLSSNFAWPYMILNPSRLNDLTISAELTSGTFTADGNTQTSPIPVAGYLNMHLFLDITALTGTWDFYAQAKDPVSGNWADTQLLTGFSGLAAIGTYYAAIGQYGVALESAIRWVETAAGSITFTMGYVLKDGAGGASVSGETGAVEQTIYLGSIQDVNSESGFPLLEGQYHSFIIGEGVDLWAVSLVTDGVETRVFKL